MKRYPYTKDLRGPKIGIGNFKLSNPLLRFFFWLNDVQGRKFKPILNTTKTRILVKGYNDTVLDCYVIEPDKLETSAPTIVYLHGGGFFGGLAPIMFKNACYYANELKCKVFLPEYRTSFKHKYPIPVEDCYEATKFIYENAKSLMVNTHRLVLYGDSAGGCLAAAVSLMARDRKTFPIAMQMLIYPVTDYKQLGESLKTFPQATWSTLATKQMWELYLGKKTPANIGYASPLYADSLSNLPFAYIEPQEIDCLCDDGIAFANRLQVSGVPTILNVVKGSYHAFEAEYPSLFVQNILHNRCEIIRKIPFL